MLIEGALRYGTNDVWFDMIRVSAQAAAIAAGLGNAITFASAGNLDLALGAIDGLGSVPPPGFSSRFLRSANRLLWTADAGNFVRTLDSLAAPLHTQAMGDALRAGQLPVAASAHLARMQQGQAAGLWSAASGDGRVAGQDAWLSPRLLVGSSVAQSFGQSAGDFGQSARRSPQAALYLRWFGNDGWYAGGSAAYARQDLALGRMLHLGDMQSTAHARRSFDSLGLQGEAGRSFDVAGGRLSPYAGMALASVRGSRMQGTGQHRFSNWRLPRRCRRRWTDNLVRASAATGASAPTAGCKWTPTRAGSSALPPQATRNARPSSACPTSGSTCRARHRAARAGWTRPARWLRPRLELVGRLSQQLRRSAHRQLFLGINRAF